MTIAILIVDDHPVYRFGLRTLIGTEADMQVAGEANTGAEALAIAASQSLDLVLMDINLPDMSGLEVTRRLRSVYPALRILVISMLDDATVFNAMKAGACGYVVKGASGEETVRAIRAAVNGEAIFSPKVAQRLQQHFTTTTAAGLDLTEREGEILALLAQGLTNGAIAERLSLSVKTVRNRVSDIFSKLHVNDRAEAIIKAREAGIG
jgi:DNA-binding NarL/FixJ family response regulator